MRDIIFLYNPLSHNKCGREMAEQSAQYITGTPKFEDITKIDNLTEFINNTAPDARLALVGGDGTLNNFVNRVDCDNLPREILYIPGGTGNDFFVDITNPSQKFIPLNQYIKNLPTVTVNGITRKFLNGIGYGIDGYCCEIGDIQRASSDKPVNYAGIAIKGLLFHFKPRNATITVDGVTKEIKKAWLCPTMKGRYYGGGMQIAPAQDRLDAEKKLTLVCMHGSGKLKTLIVFPGIFKGEHVKHKEMVEIITGKEFTVRFDKPCALQIDGDTVLNVSEYTVKA